MKPMNIVETENSEQTSTIISKQKDISPLKKEVAEGEDTFPTCYNVICQSSTPRTGEVEEEVKFSVGMENYFYDTKIDIKEDVLSDNENIHVSKCTF